MCLTRKSAFLTCCALLLCLTSTSCDSGPQKIQPDSKDQQDLSSQPIYSTYKFDRSGKVISFGTQPLYLPTGLITEVMKRDRLLKAELANLDLELQFFPFFKGKDVNFFMLKGDINVGVGGNMPALNMAAQGDIIAPAIVQSGPVSIVTRKHMLLPDLRGKRLGYASGSNAHYVLLELLASAGLRERDVKLVSLEVNSMVEALKNGKIDAYAAWEPTPELGKKQYSFVKIYQSISSGFLYFNRVFFASPEALYQIVAAQIRAVNWIKASRQNLRQASQWAIRSAEKFSGKKTLLSIREYEALAEDDLLGRNSITSYGINEQILKMNGPLHNEFRFLKNLGMLSSEVPWEKVEKSFDARIVKKIYRDMGRYKLHQFDYEADREAD